MKVDGYKETLTGAEQHELFHAYNERRKGSLSIRVSAEALWHLLQDHQALVGLNRNSYNHIE